MNVISTTPDRLTLGARPWLLAGGISLGALASAGFAISYASARDWGGAGGAALALVFCGFAFIAFVRRVIVFLDRPSGLVVIRTATVFGQTEVTHPLADVDRAEVDTKTGTNADDADTHRPILRLTNGATLPLTSIFSSGGGASRAVLAVNDWLGK